MPYLRLNFLIILLLIGSACTATNTPNATDIPSCSVANTTNTDLVSFTIPVIEMSGVAPADWEEVQVGSYVRNQNGDNSTYLLHIASDESSLSDLLAPILVAFSQEALPASSETYQSPVYAWSLYNFEYNPNPETDDTLIVDIATVETGNLSLIVILQTNPQEYETLHQSIFLSAVHYFGQDLRVVEADLGFGTMIPCSIALFDVDTVIPKDWQNITDGSYQRGDVQSDPTTLIIQTSPDLSESEFRDLFLQQFQLSLASDGAAYAAERLNWTIHNVNIEAEGILLTWQIATAKDNRYAYLVVLFSLTEEADSLRASVLLPVLDATHASQ